VASHAIRDDATMPGRLSHWTGHSVRTCLEPPLRKAAGHPSHLFEPGSVPKAARADAKLYEWLVLVDAVRGGRAREREVAIKEIRSRSLRARTHYSSRSRIRAACADALLACSSSWPPRADGNLPKAMTPYRSANEYEFVVQPTLAGHGWTLFAGVSKRIDVELVSRLEFDSGTEAKQYEPRRSPSGLLAGSRWTLRRIQAEAPSRSCYLCLRLGRSGTLK